MDQLLYIFRKGEINQNYFIYGFDKKTKNDFQNYVPWLTFTYARNRKNQRSSKPTYDPYNYICLLRDKFLFEAFCKKVGIYTPSNIGLINKGELYLLEQKSFVPLDAIQTIEMDAFCKRDVSYGGGLTQNIIKLSVNEGRLYINDSQSTFNSFKQLLGRDTWIIQERIKNQSPEYAKFHPHSINTIRIVTVKTDSSIDILCSFFRMGVNNSYVDNLSSGGIFVDIDVTDGTMRKWGFYKPGCGFKTKSDRHPNSNIVFEGYAIRNWEEILQYVKNAHKLFYGFHSIGWDVCITDQGPMLIEGNDNWDTIDAQFYSGAIKQYKKYFN